MTGNQSPQPDPSAVPAIPPAAPSPATGRNWYRALATSQKPLPRFLRRARRTLTNFSLPAPRMLVTPALWTYLLGRNTFYFVWRVLVCEPLFKAYCKKYGRGVRTGCFIHWISGKGDIVLGDHVVVDGKCSIAFAARFADCPTLEIGDRTEIGHECRLVIGKRITIGRQTTISGGVTIMDSNGHPADPEDRTQRRPPSADDVRPVIIGDRVWIGMYSIVFPGVKIGDGSIVSAGSVVRTHVPPYSVVAGNPAKVMFRLKKPDATAKPS